MNCYVCGSSVSEGVGVCPECGSRISRGSSKPAPLTPEWFAVSENQKEDHRNFLRQASYPTARLFTCKIVSLLCATVTLGLVVILLIGAIDGTRTEDYYGLFEYTYFTDSFYELYDAISTLLLIPAIAGVVIGIVYVVTIGKMGDYCDDFSTALKLGLCRITVNLIDVFVKDATLSFILSVAVLILSIAFYYFLCSGFSYLCFQDFPKLSKRWKLLFKLFIVAVIAGAVSGFVVAVKVADEGVSKGLIVWMLVVYAVSFLQEILEVVALRKTANAFRSPQNARRSEE